jgi:hypothetical protein
MGFPMKKLLLSVLGLLCASTVLAAPPYVFGPGAVIKASEMNANFAYLENLITSTAQPSPNSLIRASVTFPSNNASNLLYTVPNTGANQYVIRQLYVSVTAPCRITVGTEIVFLDGSNRYTDLMVPISAGESIFIGCTTGTGSVIATVVLSK